MILTNGDGQTVCRDLWALHLSLLPDPPPAEPYLHARENVGADRGDPEDAGKQPPFSPRSEGLPSQLDSDQEAGSGDDSDRNVDEQEERKEALNNNEDDEEEEDSELEALMRENSDLSSSSDEDETQGKSLPNKKGKRKGRSVEESPVSTIAVLVLGCWTLRIPVMYRDFARHVLFGGLRICKAHDRLDRMIESYELPYLDPLRILPPSVVPHLTKDNIQALSPPVGKSHC
jgi:RNA polymerase I-specific transcription initiation factor RRN7